MIAITGANGQLGSFILQKFAAEKIPVVGIKRTESDFPFLNLDGEKIEWREADITNSLSLMDAFKDVNVVIHSAAVVSFDPRSRKRIFQTNVIGTQNVVNVCLALGIPRLIFISSVAALGRKKGQTEINEENKWVESDLNSDYARSKYLAELEIYRGQEEGLSITMVNPSVILGLANPKKSSAQLFNYIHQERSFYSEGSLNYVDVRDVAEMVYKLFCSKDSGQKFIVSAGSIELKELLNKIATGLNKKKPSIRINPNLLNVAAWLEEARCRLTGAEALISRQSIRMSRERFIYQNQKSVDLLNMVYRPLDETLDWCCNYYKRAITTNK